MAKNRPFVGKSGKLLNIALDKAGIDRSQALLVNALSCQPNESPPSREGITACRERLVEEVLAHPRRLILTLGNSAARGFLDDHNFKITGKRGHPIDLESEILYSEDAIQEYRRSERLGADSAQRGLPEGSSRRLSSPQGVPKEQPRQGKGVLQNKERLSDEGGRLASAVQKPRQKMRDLPDEGTTRKRLGNGSHNPKREGNHSRNSVRQLQSGAGQIQGQAEVSASSYSLPPTVIFPTFHPASILRNQGEYPRWIEDIKYAGRILTGGQAALKRPAKPTAHIMLLEPDEAAWYPALGEGGEWRHWDGEIIDGSQLVDWPIRKVYTGIPAAVRAVNELLERPKLAADIETGWSYSPRLGEVICLSVAWSPTDAIVFSEGLINSKGFRPHLLRLLTSTGPQWIGHNFKYDGSYLRHQLFGSEWAFAGALADRGDLPHDSMLEHYTLDETKGTHDLQSLARDLLGAQDYKFVVKKYAVKANKAKGVEADLGYENVPREVLYPYCALDTTHTFSIHEMLCPKVHKSPSMTRLYERLLLPASIFLQKVQDAGLYVDQDFVSLLDRELGAKVKKAEADLVRTVGPLWDTDEYMASVWATKKRPDGYNVGAWRHTSFVLEKLIGWVPMNTNERTLRDLDQTGRDQSATFGYKAKNYARGHPNRKQKLNYPYIQALIDYRLASHAYSMMVKGTRKNIEPDGRLHTTFQLQATETGRLSSTGPNLQNLPVPEKDDPMPYRNIVGAPPGSVLIEGDYSQVELRLLAHFSDDDNLLEVYLDGRDLHTELSIAIWGDRVFDADGKQIGGYTNYQRVRAKAVNFGIAYGRGAGSIAAEHDIPEADAEEMRQAWFRQFPKAAKWLEFLHQAPMTGRTVVTPFGRRRRFGVVSRENYYELKNQSANFPMQGTGTDLTLFSAMRIQEKWDKEGTPAKIVCLVHDALVAECPEDIKDRVAAELTAMMEDTPMRVLKPKIPFPVDVHMGYSWGTMKTEEMSAPAKTTKAGSEGTFGKAGIASGNL